MTVSIARLAWRNLWRHRSRTVLLLVVVAYATLAIILFWGFYDGFVASLLSSQGRYASAPVLITSTAYRSDPDPQNALPALDLRSAIATQPGVGAVAARLTFPALLRSPYAALGAQVRGVEPSQEPKVSDVPANVTTGRMLTGPGEIVLGAELAQKLDVRVGERLVVDAQALTGPQALGLRVVGLVRSGIAFVDRSAVLVDIADARRLTGVSTATGLALDVPYRAERSTASRLDRSGILPPGIRAYSVQDMLSGLMSGIEAKRRSMIPMAMIFSIFAAITVLSTVVVSVLERTREFGVAASLGLDQNRLAWMVTLEATFTAALGLAIGAVLGYGIDLVLSRVNLLGPVLLSFYGSILKDVALGDQIYFATSLGYLGWASITIVLAALFAALAPARRLRRLRPAEALRAP
ncbi:MAG: FtsX-like permease family protein [Deinococcales bacterium]